MNLLLILLLITAVGAALIFGIVFYALRIGSFMIDRQEKKEAKKMAKKLAKKYKGESPGGPFTPYQ